MEHPYPLQDQGISPGERDSKALRAIQWFASDSICHGPYKFYVAFMSYYVSISYQGGEDNLKKGDRVVLPVKLSRSPA